MASSPNPNPKGIAHQSEGLMLQRQPWTRSTIPSVLERRNSLTPKPQSQRDCPTKQRVDASASTLEKVNEAVRVTPTEFQHPQTPIPKGLPNKAKGWTLRRPTLVHRRSRPPQRHRCCFSGNADVRQVCPPGIRIDGSLHIPERQHRWCRRGWWPPFTTHNPTRDPKG